MRDYRIGVIARADNRGLGVQIGEFVRHMSPDRILLMTMGQYTPYEERLERYPQARVSRYLDVSQDDIDYLLDDIDVLFSAETVYDMRIIDQASERGVAVALQGNYEFLRWVKERDLPRPDLFVAPSTWHLEDWPVPKVFVPFPVARDRLVRRSIDRANTFLHVAGHRAMRDRNGTNTLFRALRYIRTPIRMLVRSQARLPHFVGKPRHVEVAADVRDVPDYWDLYGEGDVLVAPRRFGGLSLPMQEAMSVGMPIIAFDVEPQRRYLPREGLVPPATRYHIESQAGPIAWWDCRPRDLAARIDVFAGDPDLVQRLAIESDRIANALSWDEWGCDAYDRLFRALIFEGAQAASELHLWCPHWILDCPCLLGEPCLGEDVPVR